MRLWVRIPPKAWMFFCCGCCVLSGRGLCDGLITRSEESYRLWRVVVCDLETSKMRRLKPTTNNKLEGLHQKLAQMERIRWEGQNVSEVVAPWRRRRGTTTTRGTKRRRRIRRRRRRRRTTTTTRGTTTTTRERGRWRGTTTTTTTTRKPATGLRKIQPKGCNANKTNKQTNNITVHSLVCNKLNIIVPFYSILPWILNIIRTFSMPKQCENISLL